MNVNIRQGALLVDQDSEAGSMTARYHDRGTNIVQTKTERQAGIGPVDTNPVLRCRRSDSYSGHIGDKGDVKI